MSFNNDAPSTLNNLLRLKGLKNLGTRKRDLPAYNRQAIDTPDLDMTAQEEEINVPVADEAGGLLPESFDVRANEVIVDQEQPSFFQKLGEGLGKLLRRDQPPQEEIVQETVEERTPSMPMQTAGLSGQDFGKALFGLAGLARQTPEGKKATKDEIRDIQEAVRLRQSPESKFQGQGVKDIVPQMQADRALTERNEDMVRQESINVAQETPWEEVVYGATDIFAKQPELQKQFTEYTGINFDDQIAARVSDAEKVLAEIDKPLEAVLQSYDKDELALRQRIEQQQATDQDKLYIGLALLMPLLVGGIFGAEAGLGALAGGTKGVVDVLQGREKRIREDEESLRNIQKDKAAVALKRGDLQLEKAKLPEQIRKAFPKDETAHLKGQFVSWVDPETGQVEGGKQILPDFVVPISEIPDEDAVKDYKKEARKLAEQRKTIEKTNDLTRQLIETASQIEDKNLVMRALAAYMLQDGKEKTTLLQNIKKQIAVETAPKVKVDGREVNAYRHMESLVELLVDAYRRNNNMRALTNTVAQHFEGIAREPLSGGVKMKDFIEQMLKLRDGAQNFFISDAQAQGFYAEPFIEQFGKDNREIYKKLNLKNQDLRATEFVDEILASQ